MKANNTQIQVFQETIVIYDLLPYIKDINGKTTCDIDIEYYLLYDENYVQDRYDDLYFLEGCQPLITKIMEKL